MLRGLGDDVKSYFEMLEGRVLELYDLASKARGVGLDPELSSEVYPAKDLAARVEGLIGLKGVADEVRRLLLSLPKEKAVFKLAEEVVYGRFGRFDDEVAAEYALRVSLAVLTQGILTMPLEGIDSVKIKTNFDGTRYLAIYFAGPVRSAGGTEQALAVLIGDYIRRLLFLDRYKPTEDEVKRLIEEVRLYERFVRRFQYHVSNDELAEAIRRIPIEITGTPTDPIEVTGHRNLKRVETNRLRGGAVLVLNDGIVGRMAKFRRAIEAVGVSGWDWVRRGVEVEEVKVAGVKADDRYLLDIIAGRPVFSYPSRVGGFRLRYGRSRNTGLAACGVHPSTMIILDKVLAIGTQLRLERPSKSCIITPVDCVEGPVVKLVNGDVVRLDEVSQAEALSSQVDEILFIGDLLVAFGEFLENDHILMPSGYVEEWWLQEVKEAVNRKFGGDIGKASSEAKIGLERLRSMLENPFKNRPKAIEAIKISRTFETPLHPYFTYFWANISVDELMVLREWVSLGEATPRDGYVEEIRLPMMGEGKRILESLGVPHKVRGSSVVLDEHAPILFELLNPSKKLESLEAENPLEAIAKISGLIVKDKAPTYIGARMGRPEKAKQRLMTPPVHTLFPVGLAGGRQRNIVEAVKVGSTVVEVVRRECLKCGAVTFHLKCPRCGSDTVMKKRCLRCGLATEQSLCPVCKAPTRAFERRAIDIREEFNRACQKTGFSQLKVVKGVMGLMNAYRVPELLEKGLLRAKHGLYVYKDGTIRFDATNAPLTHFKAKEAGVSVERLKKLGYLFDYAGLPLESDEQILELKIQDVLIPRGCVRHMVNVANFIDELLVKVYGLNPYYNIGKEEDLIGHLIIGVAPHTSCGVVGRVVGFVKANVCYAHPYWHSAKRRNCDGDEDSIILALDALLNFSKSYLEERKGGLMDAPLVLTITVDPLEVEDEVYNMEVSASYPKSFYEEAMNFHDPKIVQKSLEILAHRLRGVERYGGMMFTHETSDIALGPTISMYKRLRTMLDKVKAQLRLAEKVKAVDAKDLIERLLLHHFLPDLVGNLRAFSSQGFRCLKCGAKYRRLPLKGLCLKCSGKVSLTVYQGSIRKYLKQASELIKKYSLDPYLAKRIEVLEAELNTLFKAEKVKQASLKDFMGEG